MYRIQCYAFEDLKKLTHTLMDHNIDFISSQGFLWLDSKSNLQLTNILKLIEWDSIEYYPEAKQHIRILNRG